MSTRPRPRLHFTVQSGFTNDPHGIVRVADQYYMFFQFNPDGTSQSPHVSWGQASSSDLVLWQEGPVALTPTDDEVGCWSGSTVLAPDGPVIAYTSVRPDDWDAGRVVLARPLAGMYTWQRDPEPPALPGPPDEFVTVAFRDPQIRPTADGSGWRAVMGAGLPDVGGCAIEYAVSSDLRTWTLQGVLATRAADMSEPLATGTVWECPQFLNIDGNWVLIVSVWEDGAGQYVAYAIGDYDGTRFVPATWGRFAQDDLQYATTTFTDAEGRPCAMSWLRESPDFPSDDPSPWRSAMSLPVELTVQRGMLVASFHRNLDPLFDDHRLICDEQGAEAHLRFGEPWRLKVEGSGSFSISLQLFDGKEVWKLHVDADTHMVTGNSGQESEHIGWSLRSDGNYRLDVIGDAEIIEIASEQAGGIAAFRVPGWDGMGRVTVKTEDQGKVTFGRWREP